MKRLFCIVLALLLTALGLASCTVDDVEYIGDKVQQQIGEQIDTPTDENTAELSTYEKIVAVAEPIGENYTLERLNQREIFSDFSEENLKEIMAGFDVIIEKNSVIQMKRTNFLHDLFSSKAVEYNYSVDTIYVDTDIERRVLKYAMYASVFMENFPDNTWDYYSEEARSILSYEPPYSMVVTFETEGKSFPKLGAFTIEHDGELLSAKAKENTYFFSSVSVVAYEKHDSIDLTQLSEDEVAEILSSGKYYINNFRTRASWYQNDNILDFLRNPEEQLIIATKAK